MSNNFNSYESDEVPLKWFLDKNEILEYVSQEDIFELVFGFKPVEYQRVCSPFRADFSPGAYFEYYDSKDGNYKMYFIDWADPYKKHYDCFNAVQIYYNLPNFYQTLVFIKEHLIDDVKLSKTKQVIVPKIEKKKTEIVFQSRAYLISDKIFWEKYGITKQQLLDDRVLPVSKVKIDSRKGTFISTPYTLCYAYSEFKSGHKKLYYPYREGSKRFITNCTNNDIGGLNSLDVNDPQLIITKSYKDCRVLRNFGYNSIWFQNEGMIPENQFLTPLTSSFRDIVVLFDNDETGIKASKKVDEHLKSLGANSSIVYIPESYYDLGIKDPSDLMAKKGSQELRDFLTSNI